MVFLVDSHKLLDEFTVLTDSLPEIEDKFDVENAEKLIAIGYPANKERLVEFISWSCFPNDPVCFVTFPYIESLADDILASSMAEFLEFHLGCEQNEMVGHAFWLFINKRGEKFRDLVASFMKNDESRVLFIQKKYSLDEYHKKNNK